jgi:hypothetical protein
MVEEKIVSAADAAIDNEYAKQEEELRNLEILEMECDGSSKYHIPTLIKYVVSDKDSASAVGKENPEKEAGQKPPSAEDDPDERSVFVKNVDFSADDTQLKDHFKECGDIVRITIRKNPHTQQSLG